MIDELVTVMDLHEHEAATPAAAQALAPRNVGPRSKGMAHGQPLALDQRRHAGSCAGGRVQQHLRQRHQLYGVR